MKNNAVGFKFIDGDTVPIGYQWIPCHMVFDIKLDLTRKARFVAGGHWTESDPILSYSMVVTRESIRIADVIAMSLVYYFRDIGIKSLAIYFIE
jgi:hypothetical protein